MLFHFSDYKCLRERRSENSIRRAMGKRKSKRKPPPKQKRIEALTLSFPCPFCSHDRSCEVKLDRKASVGTIECRMCRETYSTAIHVLNEPIDVYNSWIDACEEQNRD